MTAIWNSAFLILWAAPILFAIAVLFDNDLIGQRIYKTHGDGLVVSALVGGLLPLLVILPGFDFSSLLVVPFKTVLVSIVGAALYLAHLYYYFDVLFTKDEDDNPINDGSSLELLLNLNIIFIPLCAWMLFDQSLSTQQWLGVFIILFAASMMSGIRASRKTMGPGLVSAIFLAAYILCEEFVYETIGIETGFFIFSATLLMVGIVMLTIKRTRPRKSLFDIKNLARFGLAESAGILAILFSHRALELNPAVLVVAAECFVPIFVAIMSLVPTGAIQLVRIGMQFNNKGDSPGVLHALSVFAAQRDNFLLKSVSALIMAIGTVLLLDKLGVFVEL